MAYNTDKTETPSTIQKAKFVYLVLFVKKKAMLYCEFGAKLEKSLFILKQKVDKVL